MTQIPFTPNQLTGFSFQATLNDISGNGDTYNANVLWNTFEQRWYVFVSSSDNVLAISTPLVESADTNNINLVAASTLPTFVSSIVFRFSTGMFEISP